MNEDERYTGLDPSWRADEHHLRTKTFHDFTVAYWWATFLATVFRLRFEVRKHRHMLNWNVPTGWDVRPVEPRQAWSPYVRGAA